LVQVFYYMVIHSEHITGSTVGGALSSNTQASLQGLAREIIVKPTTDTTQYNLTITNDNSLPVFYSNSITGQFVEEVVLPFRGIYTVEIDTATRDEEFNIAIVVQE